MLPWARRKNMRGFRKFRDDRFALTTLQNPNLELRTYAELCQAAQPERENQPAPAAISATPPAAPAVPSPPHPLPAPPPPAPPLPSRQACPPRLTRKS